MIEPTQHILEEASRLSYAELQSVSDAILEMLDDKKWDELLNSPKAIAFEQKYDDEHKDEDVIEYIPGVPLEELFR